MQLRLIIDGNHEAKSNMAIDESILIHKVPTLRLYGWNPPAVSIGFFQELQDEADMERLKRDGIHYVRRITGGGAVFHDDEVTYSIVLPESFIPGDISDSYRKICQGMIIALRSLGIDSSFRPVNDIVVGGKKISGNAQTRRGGYILQHGTLLVGIDVERMFSYLKVPKEKSKDKVIKDVKSGLTSIREHIDAGREEIINAITSGFGEALGIEYQRGTLTESEKDEASLLEKKRFGSLDWNMGHI